jgi:hypothetical protein
MTGIHSALHESGYLELMKSEVLIAITNHTKDNFSSEKCQSRITLFLKSFIHFHIWCQGMLLGKGSKFTQFPESVLIFHIL